MPPPKKFISHKQLAAMYGIHPNTLKNELRLIKKLKKRKFAKVYSIKQLTVIFNHLGNPLE